MRVWWKARVGWLLLLGSIGSIASILLLWPIDLVLPNLAAGQTNAFSVAYVLAFIPGLLWIVVIEKRSLVLEATSTRMIVLFLLDCALVLMPPSVAFIALLLTNQPVIQGAGRNIILIAALAVLSNAILPSNLSFLIPTAYLLLAGTVGFSFRATDPADWALILGSWEPTRDFGVVIGTLAATVFAQALIKLAARRSVFSRI